MMKGVTEKKGGADFFISRKIIRIKLSFFFLIQHCRHHGFFSRNIKRKSTTTTTTITNQPTNHL